MKTYKKIKKPVVKIIIEFNNRKKYLLAASTLPRTIQPISRLIKSNLINKFNIYIKNN